MNLLPPRHEARREDAGAAKNAAEECDIIHFDRDRCIDDTNKASRPRIRIDLTANPFPSIPVGVCVLHQQRSERKEEVSA